MRFQFNFKILVLLISCICSFSAYAVLPVTQLPSLSPMLKKTLPSIVAISGFRRITTFPSAPNGTPMLQAAPEEQIASQFGSGVIVEKDKGYILTNAHVVEQLNEITVTLNDKRKFSGKVLGTDQATDIALVQIDAQDLTEIQFADSDELEVGDFVVAIGHPYGLNHTVTSGIISALGRTDLGFEGYYDFIQTDASINVGNSGGGLINLKGELIGINTAIITPQSSGNIGLGLAIPSNMAKSLMLQLAETGYIARGPLGVMAQNLTPELAKGFGIDSQTKGAIIIDVIPNTPAEKAGLQVGDIITKINHKPIHDSTQLRTQISIVPIGDTVNLEYIRHKKPTSTKVHITSPQDRYIQGETIFSGLRGISLENTTPADAAVPGVRIVALPNPQNTNDSYLQEGDIILSGNQVDTPTIEALKLIAKERTDILLLQIMRDNTKLFVAIEAKKSV